VNWRIKALLQLGFSFTPFGEQLNYLAQRHVTRSLPLSDGEIRHLATAAGEHLNIFGRYSAVPPAQGVIFQFGAGWELALPLLFWAMGVEQQILIDRRRLLRPELVKHTLDRLHPMAAELGLGRQPGAFMAGNFTGATTVLRERYGIEYRAPADAARTGIAPSSADFIVAFNTLEHIPEDAIVPIVLECRRILKDGGLMAFKIDYQDHYSYRDHHISVYNFLKYSDRAWALCNCSLHYQNRLRHSDYIAIFKKAGLDILEENRIEPERRHLEQLRALPLAPRFRRYDSGDLALRGALVVVRPQRRDRSVTQQPGIKGFANGPATQPMKQQPA